MLKEFLRPTTVNYFSRRQLLLFEADLNSYYTRVFLMLTTVHRKVYLINKKNLSYYN